MKFLSFSRPLQTPAPAGSLLRRKRFLLWAGFAVFLLFAHSASASTLNIVSLVYVHPSPSSDCEDTIAGEPPISACSPIGVTSSGSLTNPFLNDINTKSIDIGYGSYYTFGNP